jgi:hypothetical protein
MNPRINPTRGVACVIQYNKPVVVRSALLLGVHVEYEGALGEPLRFIDGVLDCRRAHDHARKGVLNSALMAIATQ